MATMNVLVQRRISQGRYEELYEVPVGDVGLQEDFRQELWSEWSRKPGFGFLIGSWNEAGAVGLAVNATLTDRDAASIELMVNAIFERHSGARARGGRARSQ